jgi:phage terminase large subunit-like protein
VVAADNETVVGKKTIGLLIDELWLFGKRAGAANMLLEAMGGLASRPEGFVIDLSTQSDGRRRACSRRSSRSSARSATARSSIRAAAGALRVSEALIKDEQYKKPENWHITNPNLGASVDERICATSSPKAQRAGRADRSSASRQAPQRPDRAEQRSDGWAGAVGKRGVEGGLTLDEILDRCEVVTVGIDGGGLDDLLGVAVIGRERGTKRWLGWAHALISTSAPGAARPTRGLSALQEGRRADGVRFGHADELILIDDDPVLAELLADVPPAIRSEALPPTSSSSSIW